jgi:hypothetical protein
VKYQRDKEQRHSPEPRQLGQPRRAGRRNRFQHHNQSQQRRDGKRGRQQAHDLIRIRGGNKAVDQEKLGQTGQGGRGPGHDVAAKLLEEQEREDHEHGEEEDVPGQRLGGVRRIKPAEMPGAFQRRHAGQADRRQPVVR